MTLSSMLQMFSCLFRVSSVSIVIPIEENVDMLVLYLS